MELAVVQPMVKAAGGKKLLMGSFFDDFSILHYQDQRSVPNGGKTVGNHKGSASFHQRVKGLLNLQFGAGVNGGSGFIQNQHRRQTEHHAGNAEKLFLPLAQVIFVQNRIKTLRKAFYKFRAVRILGGLQNFFFGGVGLSEAVPFLIQVSCRTMP